MASCLAGVCRQRGRVAGGRHRSHGRAQPRNRHVPWGCWFDHVGETGFGGREGLEGLSKENKVRRVLLTWQALSGDVLVMHRKGLRGPQAPCIARRWPRAVSKDSAGYDNLYELRRLLGGLPTEWIVHVETDSVAN